jgi:hypothetical protein
MSTHLLRQVPRRERLGDVSVRVSGQTLFAVALHRLGGHGDDGDPACGV